MEILSLSTNQINQNGYHKTVLTREKIGALYTFPIDFTPEDCLACDGYSLEIVDYKELYKVIGDKFKKNDDVAGTFRIPDYNVSKRFLQPTQNAGSQINPKCLPCDGFVLKRVDYEQLFSVIGTQFNDGTEAQDEFRIPDYNITGEFLQPSTVTNKTIVAGLPNITGYISGDDYKMAQIGGAFYFSGTASGTHQETVSGSFNIVRFDASRSSSIYGRSTTVQPPARTVQICIRYK